MTATARRIRAISHQEFRPTALETRDLPDGVCGRVSGSCLAYNVRDTYNTEFAPGSLERTKREKVAAGKIQLFMDHGGKTTDHVGIVREVRGSGTTEEFVADLFDHAAGRSAKEYLDAVLRAKGRTGASIGFFDRGGDPIPGGGFRFTEVELDEISITPRPAVTGADITSVRRDESAAWRMFDALLDALPISEVTARLQARTSGNAEDTPDTVAPGHTPEAPDAGISDSQAPKTVLATLEDRRQALASVYKENATDAPRNRTEKDSARRPERAQ